MENSLATLFNNREIASAVWLGILLLVVSMSGGIRSSMWQVVRAFCCRRILIATSILLVYVAGIVWILDAIGAWTSVVLKETVLWFMFSGVALVFNLGVTQETDELFKTVMVNNLKLVIVLEFLIGTYTFSLLGELIFLPMATILVTLSAYAKSKEEYAAVAKFFGYVETAVGITVLALAVIKATDDFETLKSIDSIRRLLLPPVLSTLLVPFIFGLSVYSTYETLFVEFRINPPEDSSVTRYAKRRLIAQLGLNPRRIRQFRRSHSGDMRRIRTKNDVDRLLDL